METTKLIIEELSDIELIDIDTTVQLIINNNEFGIIQLLIDYKLEIEDNTTPPACNSCDGMREGNFDFSLIIKEVSLLDIDFEEIEVTYDEEKIINELKKILL